MECTSAPSHQEGQDRLWITPRPIMVPPLAACNISLARLCVPQGQGLGLGISVPGLPLVRLSQAHTKSLLKGE